MKFIIELSANETQKAIEQGIILDLITKASEKVSTTPQAAPTMPQSVTPTAPVTPVAPVVPATSAMPQPAPVAPIAPTTPVAPTTPQAAPTMPQPVTPTATAPTTSATFTVEQLATAAMQLKDQGRIGELQNLLAQFGVASLVQLSPEQLPVFAQALQALGVKL